MGRDLAQAFPAARLLFEEVDEALRQNLTRLMWEGPEGDLTLTENAQPALMSVSMAVLRTLEAEAGWKLAERAAFVAGHSLGEYSALCAAGSLTVADTARLLKLRGQAMQKAVPVGVGAMAALLGIEIDQAREIASEASSADDATGEKLVCAAANDNAPGQVVISGHKAAVEKAIAIAAERGFKRSIMLPVSAPFHCALMQPAADAMASALQQVALRAPMVPVIANVTAEPVADPIEIRGLLVEQVTGTVRWRESVIGMKNRGVDKMAEFGAGKVLAGLAKRIDKEIAAVSVGLPADIETFLKS
jgi:[acyl-carrier-protein] S-malonyltransferase